MEQIIGTKVGREPVHNRPSIFHVLSIQGKCPPG